MIQFGSRGSRPAISSLAYPARKINPHDLLPPPNQSQRAEWEEDTWRHPAMNSRELPRLFAFCFLCLFTHLFIPACGKLFMVVPFRILWWQQRLVTLRIYEGRATDAVDRHLWRRVGMEKGKAREGHINRSVMLNYRTGLKFLMNSLLLRLAISEVHLQGHSLLEEIAAK